MPAKADFSVVMLHLKGLCILKTIIVTSQPDFISITILQAIHPSALGLEL